MTAKGTRAKFKDNYWDIYHGRDEIMLKSIEELPGDQAGVKIVLQSSVEGFSHFLYSIDDAPFEKSTDGCIKVHFKKGGTTDQNATVVTKAVAGNGKESNPYTIKFGYYPKEFYEASGQSASCDIIIMKSSPILNFHSGSVEDWIQPKPATKDKEYAMKKWGNLVKDADSDYEKAKLLMKSLMEDLWPHNGVPSNEMLKASPFQQYEQMVSGKGKGWCSNFADIFGFACSALGVPARHMSPEPVCYSSKKCRIQKGSMHRTTEIFDSRLNQWIWMDMSFYCLGAYLGEEGPLDMVEFHLFLNRSARRERLKLHIYNLEDKSEKILPLDECPKNTFGCWEGWDYEFRYGEENVDD